MASVIAVEPYYNQAEDDQKKDHRSSSFDRNTENPTSGSNQTSHIW